MLFSLAAVLLVGSTLMQRTLNHDREALGLTRVTPLENAPPVLAFTTVALGGFRGLIANALWIRATELQENDKFFEMVQLSDWITKLEPHFPAVWINQAWNMSYNISVKFKDFEDRWRWVQRGITLLRDEGLKYNPNEVMIYRELAWHFQHKMGANLDDANMHYKQQWLKEMATVFGEQKPDLDELINPASDDARRRREILTNKFKLDPAFMKNVDTNYGPLEWRLPESHAIYWAVFGLKKAEENPTKVKREDLINLRRVIYQSLLLSLQRGQLTADPYTGYFDFGPNLEVVQNLCNTYESVMQVEPEMQRNIETAHRNALGNAVYFLYANDRIPEALKWFKYLGEKYPDKNLISGRPDSLPGNLTLEEFALSRITEDVSETSRDRVTAVLYGHAQTGYRHLILGDRKRFDGFRALSRMLYRTYMSKIGPGVNAERVGLPAVEKIEEEVLRTLLEPERSPWSFEMRAALRAAMGLPPEPPPPAAPATGTNAPAATRPAS
jgi:hypothetical protein